MKYKVTEKFVSIQGEGVHMGLPMAFLRLAGCPVGRSLGVCESWDGRKFFCDTGPKFVNSASVPWYPYTVVREELSEDQIIDWFAKTGMANMVVTGGEPLKHDLKPLQERIPLHIETSGTVEIPQYLSSAVWVTLSPKKDWFDSVLWRANEVKLLVHYQTSDKQIGDWVDAYKTLHRMSLQPINDQHWEDNAKRTVELCLKYRLRMSPQLHRWLGLR